MSPQFTTQVSEVQAGRVLIRGYSHEEIIGRLPYADATFLTLLGRLPSAAVEQAIGACAAAGAQEIVVHPFFLGPGSHTTHDIPRLVAEATAHHSGLRARVGPPLGLHEKLVDVVLERIVES